MCVVSEARAVRDAELSKPGLTRIEKKKVSGKFDHVKQKAAKRKLAEVRRDYFEQKKRSKPVADVSTGCKAGCHTYFVS